MKLDKVVVGLDFSEPSIAAARWTARELAPGAELVLVHAVDIPHPPSFLGALFPPHAELVETARLGAVSRLRELGDSLGAARMWTEVRVGAPAEVITGLAQEFQADVIVVGQHGRRRIGRGIGSTAERVARRSHLPVLLASHLHPGRPRRILVAIDESDLGLEVLEAARLLAGRFDAEVVALYVFNPTLYGHLRLAEAERESGRSLRREFEDGARPWLERRIEAAGFERGAAAARTSFGIPDYEILAAAARYESELIVMGTRGAGAIGRALIGSVATGVLRDARCPVLVLPGRA
ncbi:MAG: universal stress protein [Gemmatimonadetes bacterium]|nr:universal stress protein [Gemmatimonadota bacterium]